MAKRKSTGGVQSKKADSTHTAQQLLQTYLTALRDNHQTGAAVKETSYYPALANLFNAVGQLLKPKVRCVMNLKNQGAGMPDGGLFTTDQFQRQADNAPQPGQKPARGAIEAKGASVDIHSLAQSQQVKGYLAGYGIVLVTNLRQFLIVERNGGPAPLERELFTLADTDKDFWQRKVAHPQVTAEQHGEQFIEFIRRACLHNAPLTNPKDVAWFIASYARDALVRVEKQKQLPALQTVRSALEDALGMKFTDEKGEHFFRSTLIQTIFYGVFSAWVRWHRDNPAPKAKFDWRTAEWSLHVPFIRTLYRQVTDPAQLGHLELVEVLDWTAAVFNRVDRAAFFRGFQDEHAVQYFYEPFLEAYDPALRKELGVWYTPHEIVKYQVARVDTVLREELNLPDGLADPSVVVLDPCCGTGAYLVEVLHKIAETLRDKGGDALVASDLKQAAIHRVFGFEIMPAPFVVSHLQLGLMLQAQGAPLSQKKGERVGVYLTNALTGWEPPKGVKATPAFQQFRELQDEKDAAEHVKRDAKILVILGNPPYNGFAGVAVEEERSLTTAYRTTKIAPAPQGQGLNDLYVRFYRMAERRIAEMSGKGIVCFISNYSWLDGLSFPGMRERYLDAFDNVWVDCLNGDKFKTGKRTPEGLPDPSVFSTEANREGIGIGTAIGLLVRKEQHKSVGAIRFRHLWGKDKRAELLANQGDYREIAPTATAGLAFMPSDMNKAYFEWPSLVVLFPTSSPGVNTSRDQDLIDIDRDKLEQRMRVYFDASVSDGELKNQTPSLMKKSKRYDPHATRRILLKSGFDSGHIVCFTYRPFDKRYLYWHPKTKLLDEKRDDLFGASQAGNYFMTSRQKAERDREGTPFYVTPHLPDRHLTRPGSACVPMTQAGWPIEAGHIFNQLQGETQEKRANISSGLIAYLADIGICDHKRQETCCLVWMHALAIGYSPAYLAENADGIRRDWPRVPLPATRKALEASAALGEQIAALLDTESQLPGVTAGKISPLMKTIGNIVKVGKGAIDPAGDDLAVTAGWGSAGKGGVTMPGKGTLTERDYDEDEQAALPADGLKLLGAKTSDVHLNGKAYWRNIPANVWDYHIGGYQVIKKWLSYREQKLLGRSLKPDEAREVTNMTRRIAALILLQPKLDESYQAIKSNSFDWSSVI